jgi:hypothetical protein
MSVFIGGHYTLQDIKYDILKIIEPYDGFMYNDTEKDKVVSLFNAYLNDLKRAYKIKEFDITSVDKDNAVTFDIVIRIQKDRAPKKLKIHVGRFQYDAKAVGWMEMFA